MTVQPGQMRRDLGWDVPPFNPYAQMDYKPGVTIFPDSARRQYLQGRLNDDRGENRVSTQAYRERRAPEIQAAQQQARDERNARLRAEEQRRAEYRRGEEQARNAAAAQRDAEARAAADRRAAEANRRLNIAMARDRARRAGQPDPYPDEPR